MTIIGILVLLSFARYAVWPLICKPGDFILDHIEPVPTASGTDCDLRREHALSEWASRLADERPDVEHVGCIGSYARGDAGPRSDLDVVIVVSDSSLPVIERATEFDATSLLVPADLLVYTAAEFDVVSSDATRFARVLREEVHWVWPG